MTDDRLSPAAERRDQADAFVFFGATGDLASKQIHPALAGLIRDSDWDLPIIGIMTSPGKLVYVRNGFMNVPKLALAGWIAHEPGNCCPECFFFRDGKEM